MKLRVICAALVAAAVSSVAWAQGFSAKPIKIVIPFVPGGPSDTVGRGGIKPD